MEHFATAANQIRTAQDVTKRVTAFDAVHAADGLVEQIEIRLATLAERLIGPRPEDKAKPALAPVGVGGALGGLQHMAEGMQARLHRAHETLAAIEAHLP